MNFNRITLIILGGFMLALPCNPAIFAASSKIIAVVNDTDIITQHDITQRARFLTLASGKDPATADVAKMKEEVLKILIDEKLKLQEAKRLGGVIRDEDVEKEFEFFAQKNKLTTASMKEALSKSGVEPQTFLDKIKADLSWLRVAHHMARTKVVIAEDDIQQAIAEQQSTPNKETFMANTSAQQTNNAEKEKSAINDDMPVDKEKLREQARKQLLQVKLEAIAKDRLEELRKNALIDYRK